MTGMEQQLILQAQRGDGAAFGMLVKDNLSRIYRAAYMILRNAEDAADISQEVFIRAFRAFPRFDASKPLYPWLYRITRNLCFNHIKRADSRSVAMDDLGWVPSEYLGPESLAVRNEDAAIVRKAMGNLSAPHREILSLKHFADCSYAEMAEILDIPIGTVMSRLYNARKRLGEILRGSAEGPEGDNG